MVLDFDMQVRNVIFHINSMDLNLSRRGKEREKEDERKQEEEEAEQEENCSGSVRFSKNPVEIIP
jgi:sortase (surface protein transpeptidase)